MVSKPINPFQWSLLQVLRLVIIVSFDLIKWKLCFVSMNVVMVWRTVTKTPTTWNQLNALFGPIFPSKDFTHGQMWWKSLFTIGPTLKPMEILLTMHVTWGPHHIDDVWFSSHMGASRLGYHKLANMWRFSGVVECHVGKDFFAYATLETITFHCGWCPIGTSSIAVGCTLIFYFLLHCLVFWYYVNMGIS
jgi:hypothetical protein